MASIFRVHECEQVTERSCKLLYRHRATRCHLPEDDNHHSHRRGNLKSYIFNYFIIVNSTVQITFKIINIILTQLFYHTQRYVY
jgi:hypothetical protein